jgi:hypothetical protein
VFSSVDGFESYLDAADAMEHGEESKMPPHFALNFERGAELSQPCERRSPHYNVVRIFGQKANATSADTMSVSRAARQTRARQPLPIASDELGTTVITALERDDHERDDHERDHAHHVVHVPRSPAPWGAVGVRLALV